MRFRPCCARRCSWHGCLFWTTALGLLLCLSASFILPYVIHREIHKGILKSIIIDSPKAQGFKDWQSNTHNTSPATYFQLYFFDVTNPNEILKGAKPVLVERGPYSYRKYQERFKINWSEEGDLMEFKTHTYFVFDKETSGEDLSEDDTITNVNLALLGFYTQLDTMNMAEALKSIALRCTLCHAYGKDQSPTPFHTRTVRDIFWGYKKDPVLEFVKKYFVSDLASTDFPPIQANYSTQEDADKFTNIDVINTGKKDMSKLFEYQRFQNMSSMYACTKAPNGINCPLFQHEWTKDQAFQNGWTPVWGSDRANKLFGTDGTQFPSPLSRPNLFVDVLMRAGEFDVTGTVDDLYGIKMHRTQIPATYLLNHTTFPDNADFYMFGPNGMYNATSFIGIPFFISKPHFLDSDDRLLLSLRGLEPSRDHHDTFVDVEPNTGISMREHKRLMFSSLLTDWKINPVSSNVEQSASAVNASDIPWICVDECYTGMWKWDIKSLTEQGLFLPFAWVDENERLTEDQAHDYKNGVDSNLKLAKTIHYGLWGGSGALGAAFLCMVTSYRLGFRRAIRRRDENMGASLIEPPNE